MHKRHFKNNLKILPSPALCIFTQARIYL